MRKKCIEKYRLVNKRNNMKKALNNRHERTAWREREGERENEPTQTKQKSKNITTRTTKSRGSHLHGTMTVSFMLLTALTKRSMAHRIDCDEKSDSSSCLFILTLQTNKQTNG